MSNKSELKEGVSFPPFPAKSEIQRVFWIFPDETKICKKWTNRNIDFTY